MEKIKKTLVILLASLAVLQSCKKTPKGDSGGTPVDTTTTPVVTTPGNGTGPGGTVVAGTDPAVANTQGFFLDSWAAKTFTAPTATSATKPSASGAVAVSVDLSQITTKVSKLVFGNNTNPYMGQYVTEPTLMTNLTALSPNILRAPGGSISDIYLWNTDGSKAQQPADAPDSLLDSQGNKSPAGYWGGNNTQSWTFTIDNYYKVLQQTNSTGLITINYGYARYGTSAHPDQAAAHLAANWVRNDNGRTKYWEIGNECYGSWEAGYRIDTKKNKDGQPEIITGTIYGTHFKVFADSMRAAAAEVGNANIKIGCVLSSANDANNTAGASNWNQGVLGAAGNSPDFFVVHNYYTPYAQNSTVNVILATPSPETSSMMAWVKTSVQNAGVTQKPVALDEYNTQATGSAQNVSSIAGMHAVMVLGEALKDQYSMASRWDLANGWSSGDDQGMFNIGDEPGGVAKWNARPAFYYLYYFQKYLGDRMVSSSVTSNNNLVSYGSTFSSGQAGVVLINTSAIDLVANVTFKNYLTGTNYYYYTLKGGNDNVPFSRKVFVNGVGPTNGIAGGPDTFATIAASSSPIAGGILVTVPAFGVVYLVADKQ